MNFSVFFVKYMDDKCVVISSFKKSLFLNCEVLVLKKFKKFSSYSQMKREWSEVGSTICSFICLSAGAIEWQPCCFATILLLYAPSKVVSVLVLFVTL